MCDRVLEEKVSGVYHFGIKFEYNTVYGGRRYESRCAQGTRES